MMPKRTIYNYTLSALVGAFMLGACGVLQHRTVSTASEIADMYGDSLEPFYYYTEGIKRLSIYADTLGGKEMFGRSIGKDSLFAPSYYELANISAEADPARALEYISKATAIDSLNNDYRALTARLLIFTGKYDDALRMYNALLGDNPKNPAYYWMLALLYDYKGQPFSAISTLDSAEYKIGRLDQLSQYKRELMVRVKLYDKAIDETRTMIAESPYTVENYVFLGDLYAQTGKDSLAIASYNEALRLDASNIQALISLSAYYYDKRNVRQYLMTLNRLFELDDFPIESKISLYEDVTGNTDLYRSNYMLVNALITTLSIKYPENYDILELYTLHLIRSGDVEPALRLFKNRIESDPGRLDAYLAVLDLESYLMRPDSVYKYADMGLKRFPGNMELMLRKGFSQHYMKLYDEALRTYKEAYKAGKTDIEKSSVAGIIGDLYHEQGDSGSCYKYYRKALKLNPDNVAVLNNYAYYLSEEGRELENALKMSRRANELSPSNSTFLDTEAWILYLMGDYAKAKERMQLAISLDSSNSPVLLFHYGDILYALDDYFMAKNYWKRAFEGGIDEDQYNERMNWPQK